MEHFGNEFTTIFYLIDANSGKSMSRVLSEYTNVFVLLICWVCLEEMDVQIADGAVGYDNALLQLHVMHTLSNTDMTSYPYTKAKINALNTVLTRVARIMHWGKWARRRRI